MENNWDETYDIVVVGAGTGLFAGIAAAGAGLKTLVVEKSEYLGGSTAMSGGGLWMPGNSVLREARTGDTRERAETYLDNLVGDTAPRERRVAYLEHSPAAVDLLRSATPLSFSHMREYSDYVSELEGGSAIGRSIEAKPFDMASLGDDEELVRASGVSAPVPMPITSVDYKWMNLMVRKPVKAFPKVFWRVAQGIGGKLLFKRNYVAGGQALAAGLIAGARRAGVEMRLQTPLRDLVMDGDRVSGVVVEQGGEEVRIEATKGVILAAGGFDHNMDMRQEYQSELLERWSLGNPANTGGVINIAERHGAALTLMDQSWWFPAIPPVKKGDVPSVMLAERSLPGSMIVDCTGHRFFNESSDYMNAGQIMLGLKDGEDAHLPVWMIFDQQYRNSYVFGGSVFPRMKLPKAWYEAGIAHKADTIGELAAKLDMPGLTDGAARFNSLAAQGKDDDFNRGRSAYDRYYGDPTVTPNPNLRPLTEGPFYAVQVVPGDLGTCGGVMADENARALREDGSAIDGLYAIGNSAGNAFGHFYPGAGATIGQGLTFGLVAVNHAAGQLSDSQGEPVAVGA
ncbi:MAG: FAD-dependent oxidoreductase [Propionibacteriaceae bacterium]|nr:FAD-dependent oxidoreductase [Propionibacteriaceae bacterium]